MPISIVTAWARVQLVDEASFVDTLAPLASDAAVQDMIVDETMAAIAARVDFAALTSDVIDGVAGLIPQIDRVVILGTGENLALVRTGYAVATAVGYWLPLVSLGLFLLGVLIARRRSTALLGSGVPLLIGGGSLAIGIAIGAGLMGTVASQADLSPSALGVIYQQVSAGMAHTAAIIALLGAVIAVLAWTNGASRPAVAVRAGVESVNSGLRRSLAGCGVDTGRFGRWMSAQRGVVRAAIAALAIIWRLALRPLTAGEVFLVLIVALVAWWLSELVQVREDETTPIAVVEVVVEETAGQSAIRD
ncbi:hypothetical protein [Microbacterium telephonicum]|uniref:hypothetical protein n=1 Tax=Microbacterium telephonicum TaxID=1714841 RepID=UPI000EB2A3AC|nr:hypothetical protein [Microbacterium telephonicum]